MLSREQLPLGMEPSWKALLTATACSISASVLLLKWVSSRRVQKKIQKAKLRRDTSFQRAENAVQQFVEKYPAADAAAILSLPLSELTKKLEEGSLSPETVLYTYMGKAVEVSKKLNCATEFLLESCDQLAEAEDHREGLLYGVPVSIKDNLAYKGHDSTCGVICRLEQPAEMDSVVVQVLKKQGAIPFVKTNVPQALLSYDCSNPIFGQTVNPHNPQKTSGGSSGGEGALIAGGGSILGLGTDIGGSIRIPSSFCGICGFKPTVNRLSMRGSSSSCQGQKSVLPSLGPMARDVNSLALCMKALLCEEMFTLDPRVPPIPFNEQVYLSSKPLRIGYYENDGYHMPSPSMGRALRETRELLEKAGHTLVPFTPPQIVHAMHELALRGILADGGTTLLSNLKEGPIDPSFRDQIIPYFLPNMAKKILSFLLQPLYPRMAGAMQAICGVSSVSELWRQHTDIEEYCYEFMAEWRKRDLDVLLSPIIGPAYNFRYCGKLTSALSYSMLYNLLNLPAGVVPVTMVTEDDEEELKHFQGNFGDIWDRFFKKAVAGGQGLPVAVQCVSLPWQDELCLQFMREVEQLVRDRGNV
ncbi:fatty-acid amide hydrolase 1 [Megalops cyprinoides]|uniref:fatty-acid amide hydrolase 1 n=1 Tax=Megalops cyprinoides TaxID=118141 RepID=UPI00186446D4|nr:fatty-acid amide hydrolase 1 [Megalops cyprinoides]